MRPLQTSWVCKIEPEKAGSLSRLWYFHLWLLLQMRRGKKPKPNPVYDISESQKTSQLGSGLGTISGSSEVLALSRDVSLPPYGDTRPLRLALLMRCLRSGCLLYPSSSSPISQLAGWRGAEEVGSAAGLPWAARHPTLINSRHFPPVTDTSSHAVPRTPTPTHTNTGCGRASPQELYVRTPAAS